MEENKLIAEFMDFPTQTDVIDDRTLAYYIGDVINANNENNENDNNVFHPDDMQFHKSWDWLMPVVKKVISKDYEFRVFEELKLQLWRVDIDAVYKAVVEFIKTKK